MSSFVALITVEDIARAYDFGSSHPLRPERVLLTYDRIRELGLMELDNVFEGPARAATDEEITAVHDPEFVACVKALDAGLKSRSEGLAFGLGTPDDPVFEGMHRASAAVSGASVVAAEQIASGAVEHSFNPAGGLHHARAREASGFCIYNDPAVAIAALLRDNPSRRVMYVDVDVHHGDGVQWIFYDEPRVATVSLHQSGRYLYPGTGFEDEIGEGAGSGTSLNIPLAPYTSGEDYLWALEALLRPAAQAFRPDVLVTQLGADTHHGDPLANLGLTMSAYPPMARLLHEVAHEFCGGRWLATGGGGYQFDTVVPRVWAIHFAEMCGAVEAVPAHWLEDLASEDVSRSHRSELERSVEQVLSACTPQLEAAASTSTS
ncbi:MAG TPA: acetoin utilization protein AcuC [Actinomycetota bacterium]|nr:acetoin utilization protein AcuC [Actinomycetota bacterium]